jgi:hypothetical protein
MNNGLMIDIITDFSLVSPVWNYRIQLIQKMFETLYSDLGVDEGI